MDDNIKKGFKIIIPLPTVMSVKSPETRGLALADAQLAAAVNAMHENPAAPRTLPQFAHRAGMSRTTFAVTFKRMAGVSPMEYLTRWRTTRASDRLTQLKDSIAEIAYAGAMNRKAHSARLLSDS